MPTSWLRGQPPRLPPDMWPLSSVRIQMSWSSLVTMPIYWRGNFTTDKMVGGTNSQSFLDIHLLQRSLCSEMWRLLPFAPTMTGCDIRLRLFGIAKALGTRVGWNRVWLWPRPWHCFRTEWSERHCFRLPWYWCHSGTQLQRTPQLTNTMLRKIIFTFAMPKCWRWLRLGLLLSLIRPSYHVGLVW